jgi:hypothetical protein
MFVVFTIQKLRGSLREAQVGFLRGLTFRLRYKAHREQWRSVNSVMARQNGNKHNHLVKKVQSS